MVRLLQHSHCNPQTDCKSSNIHFFASLPCLMPKLFTLPGGAGRLASLKHPGEKAGILSMLPERMPAFVPI